MLGLLPCDRLSHVSIQGQGQTMPPTIEHLKGGRDGAGFRAYQRPESLMSSTSLLFGHHHHHQQQQQQQHLPTSEPYYQRTSFPHAAVAASSTATAPSYALMEPFAGEHRDLQRPTPIHQFQSSQLQNEPQLLPKHRLQQQQHLLPPIRHNSPVDCVDYRTDKRGTIGSRNDVGQVTSMSGSVGQYDPIISSPLTDPAAGGAISNSKSEYSSIDFNRMPMPNYYRSSFDSLYPPPPTPSMLTSIGSTSVPAGDFQQRPYFDAAAVAAATASSMIGHVPFQTSIGYGGCSSGNETSPDSGAAVSVNSMSSSSSYSTGSAAVNDLSISPLPEPRSNTGKSAFGSGYGVHRRHERLQSETSTTSGRSRRAPRAVPAESKDSTYLEKRKKNNESARKSRESRHQKEARMVDECRLLKLDNMKLMAERDVLRCEFDESYASLYDFVGPSVSMLLGPATTAVSGAKSTLPPTRDGPQRADFAAVDMLLSSSRDTDQCLRSRSPISDSTAYCLFDMRSDRK